MSPTDDTEVIRVTNVHGQVAGAVREALRQWDALGIDDTQGVTKSDFLAASVLAVPVLAEAEARAGHAEDRVTALRERLAEAQRTIAAFPYAAEAGKLAEAFRERDMALDRAEVAEAKLRALATVRVWTNEDGKRFVFADDLAAVLLPELAAPESSEGDCAEVGS